MRLTDKTLTHDQRALVASVVRSLHHDARCSLLRYMVATKHHATRRAPQTQTRARRTRNTRTHVQTDAHTQRHTALALFHIVLTSIMIYSLKSVGQDGITARHLAPFNVTKRMCRAAPRSHRRNWIIHAACHACLLSWKSKTPSMHRQPYSPRCPWPTAGSIWCWDHLTNAHAGSELLSPR